jgi:hypothetical protein
LGKIARSKGPAARFFTQTGGSEQPAARFFEKIPVFL